MSVSDRLRTVRPVLFILLFALLLHAWAVILLPQDFDEPVYLQAAFDYAELLSQGDLSGVVNYRGNTEHPALVKLLYAGGVLALGNAASWENAFFLSRALSALFGLLTIALLAIFFDPWAAAMLAIHTLTVKYTSQAYLEAVPQAMSLLAILGFLRTEKGEVNRWFWISAVALGLTAAGKYSYVPFLLVVLGYLALFEKKASFGSLLTYAAIAALTFFAANPYLWREPLPRLLDSLLFHVRYSQGAHVQQVGYPWYQPFIWLFTSPAANWHPNVFFYPGLDGVFSILALFDLRHAWRERRYLVIWFVTGIVFLLLWPTKWPQYTLTITPAIVLLSAGSLRRVIAWIREKEETWGYLRGMFPLPGKWFWLVSGAFVLFIVTLYLSAAIRFLQGRVGWSNINMENSPLPSNAINALLPLPDGKMLIATDRGAVLWSPPLDAESSAGWQHFNVTTGLVSSRVLSLASDSSGALWFGTDTGLSRFDGRTWSTFTAVDLHLPNEHILALATCDEQVYVGTQAGAALFDGRTWHPIAQAADRPVFALACREDELWLALLGGVWQIRSNSQSTFYETEATVSQFLFDSQGHLWAATAGAGLARWNGQDWDYLTPANSGLPHLTLNALAQEPGGALWIGASFPTSPGGAPIRWEGETWHVFRPLNSGASGDSVTAIAFQKNRVWLGTASSGIDIYQLGRTK
ncbi:MAG: hypothetical protein N2049_05390 [Anaerolineales bacterium]|nr:hypothetical protein [Anaerolineales bacterium]